MFIGESEYFRGKPHSDAHAAEADDLLNAVNNLLHEAAAAHVYAFELDPDTGTQISGAKNGSGDGGFRLSNSKTGAALSSHREARGIDVYDPRNKLDNWLTDEVLARNGLYREHPTATDGWCHLTTRAPRSGKRTFYP